MEYQFQKTNEGVELIEDGLQNVDLVTQIAPSQLVSTILATQLHFQPLFPDLPI